MKMEWSRIDSKGYFEGPMRWKKEEPEGRLWVEDGSCQCRPVP